MKPSRSAGVTLAALLLAAPVTFAQQKPASPPPTGSAGALAGKASIVGVVVDSLNGRYLAGAEVLVEGTKASLTTDSVGKFRLDSLAPGNYQVGVFHPLLDTLGIALATQPFHIGADSVSYVVLSIPSAPTIIRNSCKVRPRQMGRSAVIGHVVDPETSEPVAGAEVSLAWTQFEVSKEVGIRQSPRLVHDTTDASGAFHICGLPNEMDATLQARRGTWTTAEVPIHLGTEEVELFARTLLLAKVDSMVKTGKASLSGRVFLEGNSVGTGTRVEVAGTGAVATTNEKGEFSLRNLPSGTQVLVARHIGFGAEVVPVDLSSREPRTVTVRLPKYVNVMDPVVVTARRAAALDVVGFSQRKKSGMGYYISPEQIQRMHPIYLTDVLRQVPGIRVSSTPEGDVVVPTRGASMTGGGCVQYYVDNMPWQSMEPGDINHFVSGHEIVAVEVYNGPGAPAQYSRANGCTTILLWTKSRIRD
ncbi:MAG TPA: carboxypeptidase regulatory-like domain-containing protein [Gemmatimonadaceae bacterium]|nr:carboxypeptidase regulatory-like domain-containing protein [Gemmatimonadaceae bacterium]